MPQLGGPAPTIERGPINAAAPPTAPAPAGQHAARGELQRRELFPVGKENDGHVDHPGRVRRARRTRSCRRSSDRLREPDVIAVQEVAVFADGANALTGLAHGARQLHGLHHDQQRRPRDRDRLPGQGRHDGDQRPADRRGRAEPVGQRRRLRPAPGHAVRPRAVRARHQEGRPVVHGDEQPLRVAVAPDALPRSTRPTYVRQQAAALQQAGPQRARGGRPQRLRVLHAAGAR